MKRALKKYLFNSFFDFPVNYIGTVRYSSLRIFSHPPPVLVRGGRKGIQEVDLERFHDLASRLNKKLQDCVAVLRMIASGGVRGGIQLATKYLQRESNEAS